MSSHIEQTISDMQTKLAEQEEAVIQTKKMINQLCEFAEKPPIYSDVDLQTSSSVGVMRSDQFYGKPLATAVRNVLEMRQAANQGPATVREIYNTLVEGGYLFETKNEQNAMRGLRISLSKNVATFHKLPNGEFGLLDWYPSAPKSPKGSTNDSSNDNQADDSNNGEDEKIDDEIEENPDAVDD